jgi:hypothetical protein
MQLERLSEAELDELCDYITDYVMSNETSTDAVSPFGEELLALHDDIIQ